MPASSVPGVIFVLVMFAAFIIGLACVQAWVALGGRPTPKADARTVTKAEEPSSTRLAA